MTSPAPPAPKKLRRIRQPEVTYLSLCPKGKNRLPVLYKADGQGGKVEIELATVLKADALEERGELWAIAYAPDLEDSDGHFAGPEDVALMQRTHMRNGGKLDLRHEGRTLTPEEAYLAQSFIVQKGDSRFVGMQTEQGTTINEEGAWATQIQIESLDLRKKYREGKWGGVSLFGEAILEPVEKERQAEAAELVLQALARALQKETGGDSLPCEDNDMDEATLRRVLGEHQVSLLKEVDTKILAAIEPLKPKAETKKEGESTDGPPKFVGDPRNLRHVERHLAKMEKFERQQEVDWTDPDAVRDHLDSLKKGRQDSEDDDEEEWPDFLREERVAKASTRSSGGSGSRKRVSKARELARASDDMAAWLNGESLDADDE